MDRITSLLTGSGKALLANWQKIVLVIAALWIFNTLMSVGERLGKLTSETKRNGEEMVLIRGQLGDLKNISNQMLDITREQMAITKKLSEDYEKRKATNQAVTNERVDAVAAGALRLSVRKPATPSPIIGNHPADAGQQTSGGAGHSSGIGSVGQH